MIVETPSVFVVMTEVMRSIGAVGKNDYNDHQRFNFRGIDSITNAVYQPMCEHGVFVAPEVIDAHYELVTTSTGKPSRQATLTVRYRFYGPAGDYVDAVTVGEAMDSADKATSKALAAAFKYALLQTFVIPTAGQDDADAFYPERGDAEPAPSGFESHDEWERVVLETRELAAALPAGTRDDYRDWFVAQGFVQPWDRTDCDRMLGKITELSVRDDTPADIVGGAE